MTYQIEIGDEVKYNDKVFTVLGFAASEDDDGYPLIELTWNPEYMAVPRNTLTIITKIEEVEYDVLTCFNEPIDNLLSGISSIEICRKTKMATIVDKDRGLSFLSFDLIKRLYDKIENIK